MSVTNKYNFLPIDNNIFLSGNADNSPILFVENFAESIASMLSVVLSTPLVVVLLAFASAIISEAFPGLQLDGNAVTC